ncbi:D-alanyl-D-alanine carboxypeptidase/D-alanyl-D-alanine-endopeptidase [Nocardia paucivorans]|uniref:D-alanyl-D-alanine carboxypeptidase/D-alanyl-D-alanine-endopeptidase n=1 Tax=Nocardia paucivorans TaxID=114259 RepID=UPI0012FC206D|nr:D-alanyl-D-alanine carboxypeptidase [Nocardia paucivorans]
MLITVLVVLVGIVTVGSVVLRPWTPEFRHGGLVIADPPEPVRPSARVAPASDDAPAPSVAGLAAALAPVVGNPDLGAFSGSVTDAATQTVLWSADENKAAIPSSTAKILTTAAALLALPADHRVHTRVVTGTNPKEIVLVAGGDPTLTVVPDGKGYYPNGPRLADLADQLRRAGVAADTILVDISVYSGPTLARGWDPADIGGGSIAPIEPVMLDGGRLDPPAEYSPRSTTPALDVGRALAGLLGLDPARVRSGTAPANATELASVASAPLRDRLHDMMVYSDNVLAETIGREIAVATGRPASFDGAVQAVAGQLRDAGFDLTGVSMYDTSGLSTDDRIPARLLDRIVATAASGTRNTEEAAQPTMQPTQRQPWAPRVLSGPAPTPSDETGDDLSATLAPLLDHLPVAGGTGSLTNRFVTRDRAGAGWVRAKTGTLSVASTLVGYVLDSDGRVLTFALMSNDRPPEVSRPALDAVAATLRNCGCA